MSKRKLINGLNTLILFSDSSVEADDNNILEFRSYKEDGVYEIFTIYNNSKTIAEHLTKCHIGVLAESEHSLIFIYYDNKIHCKIKSFNITNINNFIEEIRSNKEQ